MGKRKTALEMKGEITKSAFMKATAREYFSRVEGVVLPSRRLCYFKIT